MTRKEQISNLAIELYNLYANNAVRFHDIVEMAVIWADAHQPSPWISVEERLPEINQVVLTLGSEQNDEDVRILFRSDVSGNFVCIDYDEITHWMPIPELTTTK